MAGNVALFFRISANIDDLKASLAQAQASVETTAAAMKRMSNSLDGSKLIADANAMVVAIDKIGGVSSLTQAEQARVNATVQAALDKYQALGQQAPAALRDLAAATTQVGESTEQSSNIFSGFISHYLEARVIWEAAKTAYRDLVEFIEGSIDAYAQAETAERRLTVAIQTQGLAIPGLNQQYIELARSYQDQTAYSHTAIEGAEALFVQLGNVGPDMMDRALKAATDLSSGLGMDLNSAVELLSKAAQGQTQTFTRYGIVLDQAKVKSEGFGYVLDAIESKVGGQAQAELDTYAGKVKQLGNYWDDLKEAIGGAIVQQPLVTASLDLITDALKGQSHVLPDLKQNWAGWLELLAPGTGGLTETARAYLQARQFAEQMSQSIAEQRAKLAQQPTEDGKTPITKVPDALTEAWKKSDEADNAAAKAFQTAVKSMADAISGADVAKKVQELNAAIASLGGTSKLTQPELDRLTKQADELMKSGAQLPPAIFQITHAFDELMPKVKTGIEDFTNLGESVKAAIPADQLLRMSIDALQDTLHAGTIGLEAYGFAGKESAVKVSDGFNEAVKGFETQQKSADAAARQIEHDAQEMARAFDQLGSLIGGDVGNIISSIGHMVSALDSASKSFKDMSDAKKAHDTLGEIASGISGVMSIASAAIPIITSLWNHFFGTAGRDAVTQFANSMGGFDALHQQLAQLGSDGERLWVNLTQGVGRNNPQQAQAAIDAINTALGNLHQTENSQIADLTSKISALGGSIPTALDPYIEKLQKANILTGDNAAALKALEGDGTPTYDTLQKLQQKYNLTAAQMGPSFQTAQIDQNFQTIIDDLDTLTRGGADLTTALFTVGADGSKSLSGLGQAVDDDIEAAIKAGVQIPANLEPAAKALFDQGDLVDANGKKITDFNSLSFGETMQTSLDNLNKTLNELIDKLAGDNGLAAAVRAVPTSVDIDFKATKSGDWPAPGGDGSSVPGAATGGYVTRDDVIPFPSYFGVGGFVPRGTDTVPAMLSPGEVILNAAQQKRLAGAVAGGDTPVIEFHHTTVLAGHVIDRRVQRLAASGAIRTRAAVGRSN